DLGLGSAATACFRDRATGAGQLFLVLPAQGRFAAGLFLGGAGAGHSLGAGAGPFQLVSAGLITFQTERTLIDLNGQLKLLLLKGKPALHQELLIGTLLLLLARHALALGNGRGLLLYTAARFLSGAGQLCLAALHLGRQR